MYWFTADEHYGHKNIIKYCERPFGSVEEMNKVLVRNHNAVVKPEDVTYHLGDFALLHTEQAEEIIAGLNGQHIFLVGSHDLWIREERWGDRRMMGVNLLRKRFPITLCHYCMRVWHRHQYNSWHLYGHSHGKLPPIGKSWDVGVDVNGFMPLSLTDIERIMENREDNPGYVARKKRILKDGRKVTHELL